MKTTLNKLTASAKESAETRYNDGKAHTRPLPVYKTEVLSKTRTAIYKDGEYMCQLKPKEAVFGFIVCG
jgi:hypothetical protein